MQTGAFARPTPGIRRSPTTGGCGDPLRDPAILAPCLSGHDPPPRGFGVGDGHVPLPMNRDAGWTEFQRVNRKQGVGFRQPNARTEPGVSGSAPEREYRRVNPTIDTRGAGR